MQVFIKRKNGSINATGMYNEKTKELTVLKGSVISGKIAYSDKFRGSATIEKNRKLYSKDGVVSENVTFKSASTAANFVTGSSTNGLTAWKDKNGTILRELI